jgi:hypothetical protein
MMRNLETVRQVDIPDDDCTVWQHTKDTLMMTALSVSTPSVHARTNFGYFILFFDFIYAIRHLGLRDC